jgi:hypothetical protein
MRGPKRSNSGHSHGKGKKRVSDEGMYEEEGLLSGLRGKGVDLDEEEVESVSQLSTIRGSSWWKYDAAIAHPAESSNVKTRDKSRTIPLRPTG